MKDLVSIIIPAYNAQSRIAFTLESVIAQDYDDIEIIVIDDASNDNTGNTARKILESSSRKFNFIAHEHNKGECASRNTGLENAQGKYICFIDSDDLIRENFISCLYQIITCSGSDIAFCGLVNRFTDGRPDENIYYSSKKNFISSGKNFIHKIITCSKSAIAFSRFTNKRHDENINYACKKNFTSSGKNFIHKIIKRSKSAIAFSRFTNERHDENINYACKKNFINSGKNFIHKIIKRSKSAIAFSRLANKRHDENINYACKKNFTSSGKNFIHKIIKRSKSAIAFSRLANKRHDENINYACKKNFINSGKNFIHKIITCLKSDIAFSGFVHKSTNRRNNENINYACKEGFISSGETFILKKLRPSVCCCMYKSDFLRENNLLFHEGCGAGGDVEFTNKAMCKAEKVTFTNQCLYIYMHHSEMGSVRDNDTKEKKLTRYKHNTQAQIRTADFLIEHSKSEQVKIMAMKILQPQNIIRKFTIFAAENDKEKYKLLREDKDTLKILHRALSFYVLTNKPEIFFKALMLVYFPGIYYKFRA